LEKAALDTAAAHGVHTEALSPAQRAFWLTEAEIGSLDPSEQLLRIMVRSACWDGAWSAWPATRAAATGLLDAAGPTAEAVAAALHLNAATEADNPRHSIAYLDPARIGQHLTARWELAADADPQVKDAAARDRGLRSFTAAVEVARTFYLAERASEPALAG